VDSVSPTAGRNDRGHGLGSPDREATPGGLRARVEDHPLTPRACLPSPSRSPYGRVMTLRGWRAVVALVVTLAILASCSSAPTTRPTPTVSKSPIDYSALQAAIENKITTGSVALANVRAVLVSVDGVTKINHYRHGFTPEDTTHVRSVTKSVVSTLIGIAIADGIISGLDQTLGELLPQHKRAMSAAVAAVTLRQLMTMSAGFPSDPSEKEAKEIYASRRDLVEFLLRKGQVSGAGTQFLYSNISAHLVSAVLASALQRADGDRPRSVLDYAREKLFDPLGIGTRPAFTKPVFDDNPEFDRAGFGWLTDPQGIPIGAFGLRLTAADLLKLGELYLHDGVWQGKQLVPREWIQEVKTPSHLQPQYGLLWWLYTWNGHQILAARGSEGHLIVVVPDQKSVTSISSANRQEYVIDEEALFPLLTEIIIPALDR
jgi:CubicO group peptidase (beta-lactamase class C family)